MAEFTRDDCGAFVYPNGFKFALEDTGSIAAACRDFHGGQGCPLYQLQSGWHATPDIIRAASVWLERLVHAMPDEWQNSKSEDVSTAYQAVDDLWQWAKGLETIGDDNSR